MSGARVFGLCFVPLLGADTRARMWRKNSKTSHIFASSPPGRPRRALPTSKTHTNHSQVTLRSCLLREMRVFRSFKNAFCGIELPTVSLQGGRPVVDVCGQYPNTVHLHHERWTHYEVLKPHSSASANGDGTLELEAASDATRPAHASDATRPARAPDATRPAPFVFPKRSHEYARGSSVPGAPEIRILWCWFPRSERWTEHELIERSTRAIAAVRNDDLVALPALIPTHGPKPRIGLM